MLEIRKHLSVDAMLTKQLAALQNQYITVLSGQRMLNQRPVYLSPSLQDTSPSSKNKD